MDERITLEPGKIVALRECNTEDNEPWVDEIWTEGDALPGDCGIVTSSKVEHGCYSVKFISGPCIGQTLTFHISWLRYAPPRNVLVGWLDA